MISRMSVSAEKNSAGKESLRIEIDSEGKKYSASVPGGTSRGRYEARDIPLKDAEKIMEKIGPRLSHANYRNVCSISKSITRSNLLLGIEIAVARTKTDNELWKLNGRKRAFPFPLVNVIGGGKHGGGTDFQEFLVLPCREKAFPAALRRAQQIHTRIGSELRKQKLLTGKNLENAWTSKLDSLGTLTFLKSLDLADVKIGVDFAASSLWDGRRYAYKSGARLSPDDHFELVEYLIDEFNLCYVEDPFREDDFDSFAKLRKSFRKTLVVGDDLTATNPLRFGKAIKKRSVSGIIVKPNQAGSLALAQKVVDMAKKNGISFVPSHRSAETKDDWISDLCIAWGAGIFKSGIAGYDYPKLLRLLKLWKTVPGARMSRRNYLFKGITIAMRHE